MRAERGKCLIGGQAYAEEGEALDHCADYPPANIT